MVAVAPMSANAVTWVPLARRRLGERGYDQARALAVAVGARIGLPVVRLARRTQATAPQARRSGADRRAAMAGAFEPSGHAVPSSVLLVDDVLTTGATASSCAEALVAGGAHDVSLLVAARAYARAEGPGYTRSGSHPGLWLPGDLPR
jgi:predicted amidophosphoribosyltransferase